MKRKPVDVKGCIKMVILFEFPELVTIFQLSKISIFRATRSIFTLGEEAVLLPRDVGDRVIKFLDEVTTETGRLFFRRRTKQSLLSRNV